MVPTPTRWRVLRALPSLLLTWLLAAPVQAQAPTPTRPDPLDPKAAVPALRYEPAFAQFRRTGSDKPIGWREANDAVARIGGWRVYLREAQQPEPAAPVKPAPTPAPAAAASAAAPASTAPPAAAASAADPMPATRPGHKH